jgi:hypothetical protein
MGDEQVPTMEWERKLMLTMRTKKSRALVRRGCLELGCDLDQVERPKVEQKRNKCKAANLNRKWAGLTVRKPSVTINNKKEDLSCPFAK